MVPPLTKMAQPGDNHTLRILLVDDDPLVLKIYGDGLARLGFQIETATDGLQAMKSLRLRKPDLMVLDLMMPKMSGVDVLKYLRSQADLAALPVVVLSNAYMNELTQEAAAIGAQKALLKSSCTPSLLAGVIREVLEGKAASEDPSLLVAAPAPAAPEPMEASAPEPPPAISPQIQPPQGQVAARAPSPADRAEGDVAAQAREEFLEHAAPICADLRNLFQAFTGAQHEAERGVRLQNLHRKVHFVAATAGPAGCHHLAQLARVFEALLSELAGKNSRLTPSVMRTMASTVDFLGLLFERAQENSLGTPMAARALAVDDDPLSNRLVAAALRHVQLQARSTEDPRVALQWLQESRYDLILLDVEMPGMDGFKLGEQMRALPGYDRTPMIYVTSHSDFESRAKSILSGGDDLISKPVFPMELATKAVAHLLKRRLLEAANQ